MRGSSNCLVRSPSPLRLPARIWAQLYAVENVLCHAMALTSSYLSVEHLPSFRVRQCVPEDRLNCLPSVSFFPGSVIHLSTIRRTSTACQVSHLNFQEARWSLRSSPLHLSSSELWRVHSSSRVLPRQALSAANSASHQHCR
jgi:hypothetical protein